MTEFLFTAETQRLQRKYSMKLRYSLRPLHLCGELKSAVYARVQFFTPCPSGLEIRL